MTGGPSLIVREMGYSVAEFAAVLPAAMRDWRVRGGPESWQVHNAAGRLIAGIRVQPQPPRRMGSLSIPVVLATLDLGAAPPELVGVFLQRFDRGFHRGGG